MHTLRAGASRVHPLIAVGHHQLVDEREERGIKHSLAGAPRGKELTGVVADRPGEERGALTAVREGRITHYRLGHL